MDGLSPMHLLLILEVALLIIGPGKLPETGRDPWSSDPRLLTRVDGKDEATSAAPIAEALTGG
jgi:hypothetical protein